MRAGAKSTRRCTMRGCGWFRRKRSEASFGVPLTPYPDNLAMGVALCAEMDGPAGWQDPAALDANYVRRADAELFWKDC